MLMWVPTGQQHVSAHVSNIEIGGCGGNLWCAADLTVRSACVCTPVCSQPCVFKTVSLWERAQRPDCNAKQLERTCRFRLHCNQVMLPKRIRVEVVSALCGVSSCCAIFWFLGDVLAEKLNDLKQRRAEMRAANRALAKQEKNAKNNVTASPYFPACAAAGVAEEGLGCLFAFCVCGEVQMIWRRLMPFHLRVIAAKARGRM